MVSVALFALNSILPPFWRWQLNMNSPTASIRLVPEDRDLQKRPICNLIIEFPLQAEDQIGFCNNGHEVKNNVKIKIAI